MYVCDIIAAFVICSGVVVGAADWGYSGDHGPSTWSGIEGSFCANSSQSPINIITDQTEENSLGEFVFNGYKLPDSDAGTPLSISNNGHTLEVSLSDNYVISGGGLPAKYKAAQFHFHWGNQSGQGSEHTVDGKMYDAEMHIVHYNNEKYDSVGDAVNDDDQDKAGLAVLGVFLEIGDEDNEAFTKVFEMAAQVPMKDYDESFDEDTRFSVADLLPNDLKMFYRYDGSLTTPGCNEIVVWTVFEEAVSISQNQMDILRGLYKRYDTSETIQNNYRPVQELKDRIVYRNSATAITSALTALLIATVVHVLRLV